MKLKCEECGSRNNSFDESLGETVCADCGLVLDVEIFEQTTLGIKNGEVIHTADLNLFDGGLGSSIKGSIKGLRSPSVKRTVNVVLPAHVIDGLHNCNMVYVSFSDLIDQEEMHKLYLNLFNSNFFTTSDTYETRAVSLVYFMLLKEGLNHSFEEVAKDLASEIPKAKRMVRRLKKHLNFRPVKENIYFSLEKVLSKINAGVEFNREAVKTMEFFEGLLADADFTKSPNYYECICWITSNILCRHNEITQKLITTKTNKGRDKIQKRTKEILSYLDMKQVKELRGKKLW